MPATSFPGFSPTRSTERVGENPGNEVEMPGGMGTLLIYWAIKVSNTLAFLNLENLLLARKAGDFILRRDAESYLVEGSPETLAFTKRCWVVPKASHGSQFRCSDSGEGVHAKLFIAFFTSHRSPLSERLEQATFRLNCTRCLFLLGEVIPNKITTEITVQIFLPMPKVYCYLFQMYWIVLM